MEDLTDNEREEQIRQWWSDNWAWIIGGVALGLSLLAGWQLWQRQQLQSAEQDAAGYRAVIESLARQSPDGAATEAAALRERRPGSPYADQADLALARAAVESREFDKAATLLKGVAEGSKDPELRLIAQSRLARVLIEQDRADEAISLLDPAKAGAFEPLFREIRGDAFIAKGDKPAALVEFDAALAADGEASGIDRAFVELKRGAAAAAGEPSATTSSQ